MDARACEVIDVSDLEVLPVPNLAKDLQAEKNSM